MKKCDAVAAKESRADCPYEGFQGSIYR